MIQFEKRSTRETYAGQTSDLSRLTCTAGAMPRNSIQLGAAPHGAPIGRGVPIQEKTPHYHSFSSAALDPHPTVANPLLPFGKFTQAVIDGLTVLTCLILICATGVGLAVSMFFLLFCKF